MLAPHGSLTTLVWCVLMHRDSVSIMCVIPTAAENTWVIKGNRQTFLKAGVFGVGIWVNMNMLSYQFRESNCGKRQSCDNLIPTMGISIHIYTGKMMCYWIGQWASSIFHRLTVKNDDIYCIPYVQHHIKCYTLNWHNFTHCNAMCIPV